MIIQVIFIKQVLTSPSGVKFSTFRDLPLHPLNLDCLHKVSRLAPWSPLLYTLITPFHAISLWMSNRTTRNLELPY